MTDHRDEAPAAAYRRLHRTAVRALLAGVLAEAERLGRRAWEAACHEDVRENEPEALCFLAAVERRRASANTRGGRDEDAERARARELQWLREAVARGEDWIGIREGAHDLADLNFSSARPYLAARFALAVALWERNLGAEAIWHLTELLRLQSSDKHGACFVLAGILAEEKADQALRQLMARYSHYPRGEWSFLHALLAFREEGDTPRSRAILREALEASPESARLLRSGIRFDWDSLPDTTEPPGNVGWILWVNTPAWLSTPGAIEWLRKVRRSRGRRSIAPDAR